MKNCKELLKQGYLLLKYIHRLRSTTFGTPSERLTSEGFRSAVSHGTSSVPSHPTSSPVSFGPSTPVQSASAAPARLLSSPGGMSDVAGTLTPPGLPLRDPPRVAGSYGISLSDPVFGSSSGSLPCENPGQRPIPPPAPPQPAGSAGSAGVQDPYAQIMQSQSAMSMLMMQMAREMNQRNLQQSLPQQQQQQQVGQDPNQPQAAGQQGGQTGGYHKEMKMDEKWIPAMPVPGWKSWTSRGKELSGFKDWLEKFSGWLSLIHDAYGPELWETIHADYPIQPCRTPEQVMRSKRLFHILQQQFVGYSKIENLIRSRISATGITESNGFELLRLIRKEFSLMSRTEALSYREMCLKFRVKRTEHLLDIIREVESEVESFHAMLDASVIVHQLGDVRISEGDQFLLYLRNMPSKVQEFLQVHRNAVTVQQLKTGVQDYYIRTRVQGDLGSVHVAQPVAAKTDLKDKTCFNCGKKGHLAENCPEPKKCSHCGRKGHLAKDCWEKHPEKKPAAKPKAKGQPTKPGGRGKGRGKGGRKSKGRGRGNKFRNFEGEDKDEEQDEDYEDDGDPEGDDEEHPEPEGEDPSGSVNQINQMTMCVRGKPVTVAASSSSTERVGSEQHRVDEINLAEKFQSIGVGDPKRRWLVDSGATCHIISERWLSHYKVVYKYEVGIPVLKGAGDNVLPTRGMVDLECKIGKIKVIMRKVVICALDLNVLSSYSLHEQGWETRLGTLKVSGLYHKKVKFPLKISDRAWWLEVLVLKHQGKPSRRKGNGPQDMEIDHVGTVRSSLSSKACQTKADVTEVDIEHKKPVETSEEKSSCIPHVSSAENVGHFKNMRRECQVKSFEGLGPFSYVCRMMRFSEPNTNEFEPEEGSIYSERCVGDQHYVCVVNPDQPNPERVRGFPVEIDVEEGEHDAGENILGDDSGYVPTTPPKSDQGSDREPAPKRPRDVADERVAPGPGDPDDPDDPDGEDSDDPAQQNIPELEGNLLFQHESRGHWPYDRGCDACVQARGRTPARRRKQKAEESGQTAEYQLAADYTFIAGRHWRLLVMLMIHTGMLGIVVVTGNRENDVKSVASVLNEIGVGGLNIEIATDNEPYLIDLVEKGLRKSNARAYHWRNISEYRPQAKGVERAVGIAKEGVYTNWFMTESEARKLAKEKGVKILTSRWVNTQKTPTLARCRLVVRDFASGAESAFRSGIYAPTSSLDSLRCVLALASLWDLWLITSDVSTAFMYAEVEEDACDLVLLPSNISFKGERVVCLLFKAMNGLRRAPLLWFYQLQGTIYTLGGEDTFESTLFRIPTKRGVILLLVYVDDLLIASQDQQEGENLLKKLMEIWKMKITGRINCQKKGALQFLGRSIYRAQDGESSLYFGVSREYMVGIFESWGENIKTGHVGLMPKLEDVHKEFVKKFGEEPLTEKGIQRYRRVLGQLAWAALSRADLSFPISFLSRSQAKPNPAAEQCMRVFMKWLSGNLHFVQRMPAPQCPHTGESKEIVSFCDASWGLDSVSGAIFVYRGCCIKFFSRKQEVPALSSAEAEIISIVDTAKEMVSLGMLLQTMIQGIPLDPLGMPLQTTGEMGLTMFNDAKAAISMGKMDGLLRRVRHLELRVKYCQHLYRRRQLSLTHWRGDENPADGLTKSLRPLNLWTNLVDAVGLVPGPNEKGQNWIKNFLNQIKQEEELKEIAQWTMDPNVRSKKGSNQ